MPDSLRPDITEVAGTYDLGGGRRGAISGPSEYYADEMASLLIDD